MLLVGDRKQTRSVTAGEPLKLLEETAGLHVAEVTQILRQRGDYKKAAKALSEGRTAAGFLQLHQLGWIKEVPDADRYKQLADAYLAAVAEKKREGKRKSALIVAMTHSEADHCTAAVRAGLKAKGKLGEEHIVNGWAPAHLTDAQKTDITQYDPGDLIQFHQNATGYKKGTRLIVGDLAKVPTEFANRFEVYRPKQFALAVADRIRITAGGKTKDGNRLRNGSLLTVQGFTKRGDIIVDHDWVIGRDFGHLTYGVAITSHASQGVTVDKVFVGLSSESFPATYQRTAYVAVTRGREQAQIFTDDTIAMLKAVSRPDDPISATELSAASPQKLTPRNRLAKHLAFAREAGVYAALEDSLHPVGA